MTTAPSGDTIAQRDAAPVPPSRGWWSRWRAPLLAVLVTLLGGTAAALVLLWRYAPQRWPVATLRWAPSVDMRLRAIWVLVLRDDGDPARELEAFLDRFDAATIAAAMDTRSPARIARTIDALAWRLHRRGDVRALEQLLAASRHGDPVVRVFAARRLPYAEAGVRRLVELLDDPCAQVAANALESLPSTHDLVSTLGRAPVERALIAACRAGYPGRVLVAGAPHGTDLAVDQPELAGVEHRPAWRDADAAERAQVVAQLRVAALTRLFQMGSIDAVPLVEERARTPEHREDAIRHLGRCGDVGLAALVRLATPDGDPELARSALAEIERGVTAVQGGRRVVRSPWLGAAIGRLRALGVPDAGSRLRSCLAGDGERDPLDATSAIVVQLATEPDAPHADLLAEMLAEEVSRPLVGKRDGDRAPLIDWLEVLLRHETSPTNRILGARLLGRVGGTAAHAALRVQRERERDPAVSAAIDAALPAP